MRPVHRPVGAARTNVTGVAEHDRQLVQPQLPEAQRRLGEHPQSFVTSPDTVMAIALAGSPRLRPHHRHDHRSRRHRGAPRGSGRPGAARLRATTRARTRSPLRPADGSAIDVQVVVSPTSDRLQLLAPFPAWDGRGLCRPPRADEGDRASAPPTTSRRQGKWLTYRGHLENISGNLFLGAVNAFDGAVERGPTTSPCSPARRRTYPEIAKRIRRGRPSAGSCHRRPATYGEGSSA